MSPGHKREDSQSSYYFVSHGAGTSGVTRDIGDETAVIDELPAGSDAARFAPRALDLPGDQSVRSALSMPTANSSKLSHSTSQHQHSQNGKHCWPSLFRQQRHRHHQHSSPTPVMEDLSGAKKVDPKVFFSAERTYLAWMHSSILLAGVSIAISAYSETGTAADIYGVMILPIAIVFLIYAMIQYGDRSLKIRKRSPGPYEDRWGPVVLGSFFVVAVIAEIVVKLLETE
mmetsp:Transcript_123426/g.184617  ORF Transcript_123426/g.184617 Transcript_123426/m.184617 type:complete len:229 (-) Transcript_123426:3-689(-)